MIVDFDLLIRETANALGVSPSDILGASRKKNPSLARHVVMALWADDHPYQDAADRCGRNCHSTVIFAREKIFHASQLDESFSRLVREISRRCQYGAEELGKLPEDEENEGNRKFVIENA